MLKLFFTVFLLLLTLFYFAPITCAEQNKVVLAGADWEPYMGDNLPEKGFFAEISAEALKTAGYDVEIKIVPWARAVKMTKNGEYTAIMGASFTEERSDYLFYPEYSWEVWMTFFSLKGKNIRYKNLEKLCPVKIGLIRSSYLHKRLNAVKCIELEFGNSVLSNIKKLMRGRLDLYLESTDNVYYYLDKFFSDKKNSLEYVSPPFEIDKIYTAFSKNITGYEKLAKDFDKGVTLLKENGVYDRILKKHGIRKNNPNH